MINLINMDFQKKNMIEQSVPLPASLFRFLPDSLKLFIGIYLWLLPVLVQAQLITLTSQETIWVDANNCANGPRGAWLSFTITNNTVAPLTNVLVTFSGFTGTNASYFIPPHDLLRKFSVLAVNELVPVYYYVDYSRVCNYNKGGGDPYGGYTANYTITVTATGKTPVLRNGTIITDNLTTAAAAGIASSVTLGPGFYVGQLLTQTTVYSFGNNTDLFFQPAGEAGFHDGCLRLVASECTATTGGVTGIQGVKNRLWFSTASVPGGGGTITIVYTWEIICTNVVQTVHPWAAAKSGQKYKYQGYAGTVIWPAIEPSAMSLNISKSVNPTYLTTPSSSGGYGAGIAQWTVTLNNPTLVDIVVNSIDDIIPSCMTISNATVTGSGVTSSNSSSVPAVGSSGLQTWVGKSGATISTNQYKVSANSSLTLVYQTNLVSCTPPGYFNNSAKATVGMMSTGTATASLEINAPPTAVNDSYSVLQSSVEAPTSVDGNILLNDIDPETRTLTVTSWTLPSIGTLTINSNGVFTYAPATGFTGIVTFQYTITDSFGLTSTATVTINVLPCITKPVTPGIIKKVTNT